MKWVVKYRYGIYFLLKDKKIVYIGKTTRWPLRLKAHKSNKTWLNIKPHKKKHKILFKKRQMKFRKLTHKSMIGFGPYAPRTVGNLIDTGRMDTIINFYFKMSHITFFDEILDEIGITPEWRISKPGKDPQKYYDFMEAVYPGRLAEKSERRKSYNHINSKNSIKFINAISMNKDYLRSKNQKT